MKIALFGASGNIGQRIMTELLDRGHHVTALVRHPASVKAQENVRVLLGDVTDPLSVAKLVKGHNAVVCSVQAAAGEADVNRVLSAARALIKGLKKAGVRRLVVVGGAGSLEVGPGLLVIDTPNFPAAWKPIAQAHREALAIYSKEKGLDWTYFSPPALIEPGERTQQFRVGKNQLIVDSEGKSHISMEDYAVALVDEIENPRHIRERFTVGY